MRRSALPMDTSADIEEDESYYLPPAIGRSAIRHTTPNGDEIFQQGNRRLHIHYQKPPHRVHWLFLIGVGMFAMLFLWASFSLFVNWWGAHQLDAQYGNPRTSQVDEVVGHSLTSIGYLGAFPEQFGLGHLP